MFVKPEGDFGFRVTKRLLRRREADQAPNGYRGAVTEAGQRRGLPLSRFLFSMDCLEVDVQLPGQVITLYVNHLKSMMDRQDPCHGRKRTRTKREKQAVNIVDRLSEEERWTHLFRSTEQPTGLKLVGLLHMWRRNYLESTCTPIHGGSTRSRRYPLKAHTSAYGCLPRPVAVESVAPCTRRTISPILLRPKTRGAHHSRRWDTKSAGPLTSRHSVAA